jgi:hypothetical protein
MRPHVYHVDKGKPFGGWYACDESDSPFISGIVLYYHGQDEATPEKCADIRLYTEW